MEDHNKGLWTQGQAGNSKQDQSSVQQKTQSRPVRPIVQTG
jgi:hypothetical protein